MKRRLLTIVMSVAMVFAFAQMIDGADDVHAAGNPYAPNATIKGQWANCTYWAWKLAYDNTGVELPKWGNAGTWYDSAHTAGYSVGTTPRARSIVVYTNSGVGHVAYVADYNSSTNQIYIKEGGIPGTSNGYRETGWKAVGSPKGFIYLSGSGRSEVRVKDSLYVIRNEGGRFIDIAGNSKDAGANVHLWSANDSGAQVFHVGRNSTNTGQFISGVVSDKDLDTDGNAPGGRNVIQWNGNGADGQQWVFEDAGNGYVYIRNLYGYYLDIENGVNKDGTNIRVWDFNGSSAQKWKLIEVSGLAKTIKDSLYIIRNAQGRFLDIDGNSKDAGANVHLWSANDSGAQVFHVGRNSTGTGQFISGVVSDKDLDTDGNAPGGRNVIQWNGNGTDGQQWVIEDAGDGYVYIRNLYGYYLDVENGVNKDGTNIRVWDFNGSAAQKWMLTEVSGLSTSLKDDLYVIQNAGGRYLDIYENGTADGTNIQLWSKNDSGAQLFHVGRNPKGTANFISGVVSDKDLDTQGGTPGGKNVCLWTSNGGDGQQWVFENAGDGYVYIRNLFGYYLDVKDGVNADGTNVRVWDFNGSNAQKWKLIKYEKPDTPSTDSTTPTTPIEPTTPTDIQENPDDVADIDLITPSDETADSTKVDSTIPVVTASKIRTWGSVKRKQMKIMFPANSEVTNYRIQYRLAGKTKWTSKWSAGENTYIIKNLKRYSLCQFRIAGFVKQKDGTWLRGKWSKISYRYINAVTHKPLKAGKKKITVTWKKDKKATGYQIVYSLKSDMSKAKKITIKGKSKTRYTIKKLKKNKKYYVQIRPIKKKSGKTYLGILTKTKSVKVK